MNALALILSLALVPLALYPAYYTLKQPRATKSELTFNIHEIKDTTYENL